MRRDDIIARIANLLGMELKDYADHYERFQGTLTLALKLYGPSAPQVRQLEAITLDQSHTPVCKINAASTIVGILRSLRAEVDGRLLGDLRSAISGEVLADLLALAREVLAEGADAAFTNVAGVLVAAAFEDTIRRLGDMTGKTAERQKLADVIEHLRETGILKGANLRLAQQTGLPLRNSALHAEWDKITRPAVESLVAFVGATLSEHFSQ